MEQNVEFKVSKHAIFLRCVRTSGSTITYSSEGNIVFYNGENEAISRRFFIIVVADGNPILPPATQMDSSNTYIMDGTIWVPAEFISFTLDMLRNENELWVYLNTADATLNGLFTKII